MKKNDIIKVENKDIDIVKTNIVKKDKLNIIEITRKINVKYIVGILGILLIIFLISKLFKGDTEYPVIYNNSDGDLYLMNTKAKDESDALKLAKSESVSNVIYANTTERYVLFQKDSKLYIYDAKDGGETTKIMDNLVYADFSDDDKYVISLDNEEKLYIYNYKDTVEIDDDVSQIYQVTDKYVVYEKENKIYVRGLNPKKDNRRKVTEEYDNYMMITEDNKRVLFINKNRELVEFNIRNGKSKNLVDKVDSYYCADEECKTFFYLENDDTKNLNYYDGKNDKQVVEDVYMVNDTDDKKVLYTKLEDSKYALYYVMVGKDPVLVEKELNGVRSAKLDSKDIYYIPSNNDVKYAHLSGKKVSNVKVLASGVIGYLQKIDDGYTCVGDIENNLSGNLYIIKNGKAKKIDENVNNSIITISKKGNKIYYLKDYKTSGSLYVTSGGKGKKIDDDVYNLEYVKDDLIYYIKDYSIEKSRGDLYRYTGKSKKIAENVTRIANPPVVYDESK